MRLRDHRGLPGAEKTVSPGRIAVVAWADPGEVHRAATRVLCSGAGRDCPLARDHDFPWAAAAKVHSASGAPQSEKELQRVLLAPLRQAAQRKVAWLAAQWAGRLQVEQAAPWAQLDERALDRQALVRQAWPRVAELVSQ